MQSKKLTARQSADGCGGHWVCDAGMERVCLRNEEDGGGGSGGEGDTIQREASSVRAIKFMREAS